MSEIELFVLGKQCIDRRIGEKSALHREIGSWEEERNLHKVIINWQFTTEKARTKFKRHYDNLKN